MTMPRDGRSERAYAQQQADERFVRAHLHDGTFDLEELPGGRVRCRKCGIGGWPLGLWLAKHATHTECPVCDRVVTEAGLIQHLRHHYHDGKVPPDVRQAIRERSA